LSRTAFFDADRTDPADLPDENEEIRSIRWIRQIRIGFSCPTQLAEKEG